MAMADVDDSVQQVDSQPESNGLLNFTGKWLPGAESSFIR